MKTRTPRYARLFALRWWLTLSVLLMLTGCANTLKRQFYDERQLFNVQLEGMHTAHALGAMPAKSIAAALPYEKATAASLDAGDDALANGDTSTASVYLKAAHAGLLKLPTTKPVK